MQDYVHLAVGQFPGFLGRTDENLAFIERLSAAAAKEGAEFILFPEDCLNGYPGKPKAAFDVAVSRSSSEIQKLKSIAQKLRISVAAGFIERLGEHCHSAHLFAWADGTESIVRKYSVDDRDQRIGITPAAPQDDQLQIAGAKTALAICMDGTDAFFDAAKRKGVQIILHPSGGACEASAHAGDANAARIDAVNREGCEKCLESARKRARSLNAIYCSANSIGFDGERGYPGNSWIISATGEALVHLKPTAIIENMTEGFGTAKVPIPRNEAK